MQSSPTFDVIVVGAGIAGLTSAALLAHSGARVLLLEHHDKVGGCAGYFSVPAKFGTFTFPTGATAVLGLEAGGLHNEIFQRLGVECPAHPIDRLAVYLPDLPLNWWHDAARWRIERRKLPGNRFGQEIFWRLQELIGDSGWFALSRKPSLPLQNLADLRRNVALAHPQIAPMLGALPFSIGEVMKRLQIDRDPAFSALVNLQLLITTQSLSHAAPLGNAMAGLDLWRHGAYHPLGGVGSIAQKLLEGFEKHGGEIEFGCRVEKLRRVGRDWEAETQKGTRFQARHVVANVPVWNVKSLVESAPDITNLEKRAGSGWGAIMLYIALKESALPTEFPLHGQVLTKYHPTPPFLKAGAGDDIFLSLSHLDDESSAPRGWRTLNISTHVRLKEWKNLTRLEYRDKKKFWREKLLDAARVALPNLDEGRGFIITSTPATWEDYTLRQSGSVGGAALTRRNANLRALPSRIGLENFSLVGDTTFPGQGTVACALSGYNAWRDVMDSL